MSALAKSFLALMLMMVVGLVIPIVEQNWRKYDDLKVLDDVVENMEDTLGPNGDYIYGRAYLLACVLDVCLGMTAIAAMICLLLKNRTAMYLTASSLAFLSLMAFFFQPAEHGLAWRDDDFTKPLAATLVPLALISAVLMIVLVNRIPRQMHRQPD